MTVKRKLIEVALPLEAINRESARENARTLKFETHEFED